MGFVSDVTEMIKNYLGISPELQEKIFITFIIVFVITIISRSIRKIIHKKVDDITVRYQWQKIIQYVAVFFILIFIMS